MTQQERVTLLQLNRPKARNALCDQLMRELGDAILYADINRDVGCLVLTGD